jgi:serine protease Do
MKASIFNSIVVACLIFKTSTNVFAYTWPQPSTQNKEFESKVEILKKIQEGFNSIVSKTRPAVVFVSISKSVTMKDQMFFNPFEEFFRHRGFGGPQQNDNLNNNDKNNSKKSRKPKKFEQQGLGSGFIIDNKNGYILTNNHVVGDADKITVHTFDGKKYEAVVKGTDEKTDVAVIQVKNLPSSLGEIFLSDSNQLQVGDFTIAVGAPHGLDQSVTQGIVSAKGRGSLQITGQGDFIQTDAAINPGNSGGPLLNIYGDAIGMNTAIFSQSGGSQGIGFAIPSTILKEVASKLITDGKINRGYLGIMIQNITDDLASGLGVEENAGVLISQVEPRGAADKAGLKSGDIVTKVNGEKVSSSDSLSYKVSMTPPGEKVELEYLRKGKTHTVKIQVQKRSDDNDSPLQGLKGENEGWGLVLEESKLNDESQTKGLLIVKVQEDSPAEKAQLREGDFIVEVNQEEVATLKEFKKYDNKKNKILLKIIRDNRSMYVPMGK